MVTTVTNSAVSNSWAGVPLAQRKDQRREQLVRAAFDLFGTEGDVGVTVRAVCRATNLNARYFYESFADIDDLLAAVYDEIQTELGLIAITAVELAGRGLEPPLRAGIRAVLEYVAAEPRRGRVLFTGAQSNPVLIERRRQSQDMLTAVFLRENSRSRDDEPERATIRAVMFTGAMSGLVGQWMAGALGDDLDAVVDLAVPHAVALAKAARRTG
jgi:AcrR family transcriptional regulator